MWIGFCLYGGGIFVVINSAQMLAAVNATDGSVVTALTSYNVANALGRLATGAVVFYVVICTSWVCFFSSVSLCCILD